VKAEQAKQNLSAVYYSKNGLAEAPLKAAEKLLAHDEIETVYANKLEQYYYEHYSVGLL